MMMIIIIITIIIIIIIIIKFIFQVEDSNHLEVVFRWSSKNKTIAKGKMTDLTAAVKGNVSRVSTCASYSTTLADAIPSFIFRIKYK